jgi:hypothetical protein
MTGDVTSNGTTNATTIGTLKVTNGMLAGSIDLTTKTTGVLPVANGGTNLSASGTESQVLKVVAGAPKWQANETGNLLLNAGFEGSNTAGVASYWVNSSTNSTPTITTSSGEFSESLQAQKIALASGILNFSQSVSTPSGIQKQGTVSILYKVPSTVTDFKVCSLVDSAEQMCVPTAQLILDNLYHSIEIPITFGATNAGVKAKTTSAFTANVFFDGAVVKQGLGISNLTQDTDWVSYTPSLSNFGNATATGTDWINASNWYIDFWNTFAI